MKQGDAKHPDCDLSTVLVRRIQAGDADAWRDLYVRYRDQLLFSIRCRLGARLRSRLESEDILHSIFRDALEDLLHFQPRGAHALEHYLHTCALNKIRNKAAYFAAKKRAGDVPLDAAILEQVPNLATEVPAYCDSDRYRRLEQGMDALPENLREVILLRSIEGLTNSEAADVLGKSVDATSKLYNRAVARLGGMMR